MKKLSVLLIFLTGCSSHNFLSEKEDIWVTVGSKAENGIYYCQANKQKEGDSKPKCIEAKKIDNWNTPNSILRNN